MIEKDELQKQINECSDEINKLKEKIETLQLDIAKLDTPAGFNADEIFLLSKEECEKYKDAIPVVKTWWWTRSANASNSSYAFYVNVDYGSVNSYVVSVTLAVRPAWRIKFQDDFYNIGERRTWAGFPWIKIDNGLYIAEVPIGFEKFDDNSNDYENSYIRHWLKDWLDERK